MFPSKLRGEEPKTGHIKVLIYSKDHIKARKGGGGGGGGGGGHPGTGNLSGMPGTAMQYTACLHSVEFHTAVLLIMLMSPHTHPQRSPYSM